MGFFGGGDLDIANAIARSFQGKLPPDVLEHLTAEGELVDIHAD